MPAPAVALAGAALRNPRRTGRLIAAILALLGLWILFLIGAIGSITGLQPLQDSGEPSPAAVADIPGDYLELYQQAGARYGVDPWVLAAIGKIETDHGRSPLPGIRRPTTNTHGCCAGPMQMCVIDGCPPVGSQRLSVAQAQAGTWRTVGVDGNRDGQRDPVGPRRRDPRRGSPADRRRRTRRLLARDLRLQPRRLVRRRRPRPGRRLPRRRRRLDERRLTRGRPRPCVSCSPTVASCSRPGNAPT